MPVETLSREREGLQLVKFFAEYCFNVGEIFSLPDNTILQEAFKKYSKGICDNCSGAMDCSMCPVCEYNNDIEKFINGERTRFSKDYTKDRQ